MVFKMTGAKNMSVKLLESYDIVIASGVGIFLST